MTRTSVDLVVGAIAATVEFWPLVRDDAGLAPEVARNLLALWGNVRRFPREATPSDLLDRLERCVREDGERLAEHTLAGQDLASWRQQVLRLERSWERARTGEHVDEREDEAADLFELLDRVSLAVYAVQHLRLFPPGDRRREALVELRRHVRRCELFVLDRPEIFLAAADLASDLLAACRPDLDEFDPPLWDTTVKHRALEEALEEAESDTAPVPFSARDRAELLACRFVITPSREGGPAGHFRVAGEMFTALAAKTLLAESSQQGGDLPRTEELPLPGGPLVVSLFRPAGKGLVIEFRSSAPRPDGLSVELVVVGRGGAELLREVLPLRPNAEQVLTARCDLSGVVGAAGEYDIRYRPLVPGSSPGS